MSGGRVETGRGTYRPRKSRGPGATGQSDGPEGDKRGSCGPRNGRIKERIKRRQTSKHMTTSLLMVGPRSSSGHRNPVYSGNTREFTRLGCPGTSTSVDTYLERALLSAGHGLQPLRPPPPTRRREPLCGGVGGTNEVLGGFVTARKDITGTTGPTRPDRVLSTRRILRPLGTTPHWRVLESRPERTFGSEILLVYRNT